MTELLFQGRLILRFVDKHGEENGVEWDIRTATAGMVKEALDVAKAFVAACEAEAMS